MVRQARYAVAVLVVGATLLATACHAQDWPAFRHDASRGAIGAAHVDTPLKLAWTYAPRHAPRPAWPEPGRELHRMAFDYAYQVAVADGVVYFGSSADHKVYALDLATGEERWSFFTGGPIRFAPTVADGRVYVAGDDGWLYCLSAADGSLDWKFCGAPSRRMIMGNEQLISHHPLRSGVIADGGVVYFSAGMWPSDGIYLWALDAADGTVLWSNATAGTLYVRHPHPPAMAFSGVAPQGYLVADGDQLFVPTGRNVPAAFDRATGELQYYYPGPVRWADRWGGSWVFTAADMVFCWKSRPGPDIDVEMEEHDPWPKDGMAGMRAEDGGVIWEFTGKLDAVLRDDVLYASGGGNISAHDMTALLAKTAPEECRLWETPHGRAYALIMADDTLFAGGRGEVTALAAADGEVLWRAEVDGQARGLAAADGRLLVSLDSGRILCFGADGSGEPAVIAPPTVEAPYPDDGGAAAGAAERILEQTGVTEGYCVELGAGDGRLAWELARQSDLRVWCVEADSERAAAARRALDAAGLYGVRVTVHEGTLADLGYPRAFADLIIVGRGAEEEAGDAADVYRVLKPGGVARVQTSGPTQFAARAGARAWLRRGDVPGPRIGATDDALIVRRPAPAGAGEWTHQYGNIARTGSSEDQIARLPVEMRWFGRPGPAMMVTRHWRGPAPLCVDGRLFVIGQFRITAVDAYNGRELWAVDLPAAGRFPVAGKGANAAADADAVYIAVANQCLRLDAATGEQVAAYEIPECARAEEGAAWWYVGVTGDLVLGTAGNQAGGRVLFALDRETGELRWAFEALHRVNHDSIVAGDGRVFVIDAPTEGELDQLRRRGQPTRESSRLVGLDARSGAVLWTTPAILPRRDLRLAGGVLLATGGGRMSAYSAEGGEILSWGGVKMRWFPVIIGDTIYGQPYAYDLRTGTRLDRVHPLTGRSVPWSMARSYGCGAVSGAPNLLAFRSGTLGFYDLAGDSGVHNFGAIRAGCYVNAIMAAGMVLMPPADAACTCSYNFQATVALAPAERDEEWAVFATGGDAAPIVSAALNLGAPGDRRDPDGRLWLAIPRPGGLQVPVEVEMAEGGEWYHRGADEVAIGGDDRAWLYACGAKDIRALTVNLGSQEPRRYRVRLHFAELDDAATGPRVFDVKLQGEPVLEGLDVAAEAGARNAALVREFEVEATEALRVEFIGRGGEGTPGPILSAIEVERL